MTHPEAPRNLRLLAGLILTLLGAAPGMADDAEDARPWRGRSVEEWLVAAADAEDSREVEEALVALGDRARNLLAKWLQTSGDWRPHAAVGALRRFPDAAMAPLLGVLAEVFEARRVAGLAPYPDIEGYLLHVELQRAGRWTAAQYTAEGALDACASDASPWWLRQALVPHVLAALGQDESRVLGVLERMLRSDEHRAVRVATCAGLEGLPRVPEGLPGLLLRSFEGDLARGEDVSLLLLVVDVADHVFAQVGPAYRPGVTGSGPWHVLLRARLGILEPQDRDGFLALLRSDQPWARWAATHALGEPIDFGEDPASLARTMADDPVFEVRDAAFRALRRIGSEGALGALAEAVRATPDSDGEPPSLRELAGACASSASARRILAALLAEGTLPPKLRAQVAGKVWSFAGGNPSAQTAVAATLVRDQEGRVGEILLPPEALGALRAAETGRRDANWVLPRAGLPDPRWQEILAWSLRHGEPLVQGGAQDALVAGAVRGAWPSADVVALLVERVRKAPSLAPWLIHAVSSLALLGGPEAREALASLATGENEFLSLVAEPSRRRAEDVRSLVATLLGARDRGHRLWLLRDACRAADWEVRRRGALAVCDEWLRPADRAFVAGWSSDLPEKDVREGLLLLLLTHPR